MWSGCQVSPGRFFIAASTPKLRNPLGTGPGFGAPAWLVTGEKDGRPTVVQYDLVDYHDRENLSSPPLMRTTGYSLAIHRPDAGPRGRLKLDGQRP